MMDPMVFDFGSTFITLKSNMTHSCSLKF